MVARALPIRRGCGRRVRGGIYLEVGLGPGGRPVEDFLIDPPLKLGPEALTALGVHPVGVSLVERQGATHVLDWVGSEHYPNVADFVEEVRVAGLSRRLSRSLDFSRLGPGSRILLIHARAWIDNAQEYYRSLAEGAPRPYQQPGARRCPRRLPGHDNWSNPPTMCAQLWWQDVAGGHPVDDNPFRGPRTTVREMPAFSYLGLRPPDGVEARYTPAIFASFPVSRLVVISDPAGGHEEPLRAASRAHLPVELEEE